MDNMIYIAIMAGITYLIRVIPITLCKKQIPSRFVQSFLYYVPYAVLAALTFPAIFDATGNQMASITGTVVALVLAFFDRGLVLVAVSAVVSALIVMLAS